MKQTFRLLSSIAAVALLFVSCEENSNVTIIEAPTIPAVGELIAVQISASEVSTKVSYEPNDDNSTYSFSWSAGDLVSVVVPDTDYNTNQKFTAATSEASTQLDGEIATWDGSKTLYAIWPYSAEGYSVDASNGTIFYDNSSQTIDASVAADYSNSLIVAAVSGAIATSATDYNIPDMSFTQVMSIFELSINDIPSDEVCTTVGFEAGSSLFVASADINLSTGVSTPRTYSSSVSVDINNHSGSEVDLNIVLLPADLSNTPVTLYVTTISDTESKKYTYTIEGGLNFASSALLYSDSGALSLTDDFTEAGTGVLRLSDFDGGFIPSDDTWVIVDAEATSASFDGLKSVLASVYSADNSRRISIEFPYLNAIPNYAFSDGSTYTLSSISAPVALSIGESAFSGCRSLSSVDIPLATSISDSAFSSCSSLSSVYLPLATSISDSAFSSCISLSSVYLPLVTSIGSSAFSACISLSSVDFSLVTTISNSAFINCSSLSSVAAFPLATSIGSSAFRYCYSLSSVDLPLVTSIDSYAFDECSSLSSVDIPLATSIGSSAFCDCISLVSVEFPAVTSIGMQAFYGCDALRTMSLATNEDVVLSVVGTDAFRISDTATNEENITLTLGLSNSENVDGNTLTVKTSSYSSAVGISYTFSKIIISGGSESGMLATASNLAGIAW